jgi:hypothetical protein
MSEDGLDLGSFVGPPRAKLDPVDGFPTSAERSGDVGEEQLAEPLGLEAPGRVLLLIANLHLNLAIRAVIRKHHAPDRIPISQPGEARTCRRPLGRVRTDDLDASRDLWIRRHQYCRRAHASRERDGCKKTA